VNLSDATFNFDTEKAMIAMAMALLIIAGEIDLSGRAIIALARPRWGPALQMGAGHSGTGADRASAWDWPAACSSGLLVAGVGLPSIASPSAR